MTKKFYYGLLVIVLVTLSLVTACNTSTSTIGTSTKTTASTTTTAATQANWWDEFGTPQYGGTITTSLDSFATNFDVYNFVGSDCEYWHESLFTKTNSTLDRSIWSFKTEFAPEQYYMPLLAESWEQNDTSTITVKIRQGITWQNKEPLNGREFTAYDIQSHYERILGQGAYTTPAPMYIGMTTNWASVTATDNYTVVFKFKEPSGTVLLALMDSFALNCIEAPELVAAGGGGITDWKAVVGTGAWILTDYVDASSLTYSRNPSYWGYDERYPENQLPYAEACSVLIIPDTTTKIAALRTGKIDLLSSVSWQQAENLAKTNSELMQGAVPSNSYGVSFRLDKAPFTDINVRKALQMAIDRDSVATNYYGGTADARPSGLVNPAMSGYCYAYEDWPQELKDEYSYNPTRAKELLSAAGYPDGFSSNVVVSSTSDLSLMQVIKAYFTDIGVDMEIKTMEYAALEDYRRAGKHDQMLGANGAFTSPPSRVIDMFYSKGSDQGNTMVNDAGYDAIRAKFWAALEPTEVAKVMTEADKYVIEKHWMVTAGNPVTYNIWQPYIKGYSGEALILGWDGGPMRARLWINKN